MTQQSAGFYFKANTIVAYLSVYGLIETALQPKAQLGSPQNELFSMKNSTLARPSCRIKTEPLEDYKAHCYSQNGGLALRDG